LWASIADDDDNDDDELAPRMLLAVTKTIALDVDEGASQTLVATSNGIDFGGIFACLSKHGC
jgi:hypothetical protein